jgi:hypothetical protein
MGHVDLHEKRQLDLAEHMARVNEQVARARAHTRPWRAIIALVLALIAAAVATQAGTQFRHWTDKGNYTPKLVAAACIGAFCVLAGVAIVGLARKAREVLTPAVGAGHAAVVRYTILLVGGVGTLLFALTLMKVPIGQLLVGGAVTTILLGIAAQQSLANVFAGLVLLLSRPFTVGDRIRLKSGALGGVTEGMVTEIGITYLRIDTEDGVLNLPNSQVLAAAVGPVAGSRPGPAEPGPGPVAPTGLTGAPQVTPEQATAGTAAAVPAGPGGDASGPGGDASRPGGDASGPPGSTRPGHDGPPAGGQESDRDDAGRPP